MGCLGWGEGSKRGSIQELKTILPKSKQDYQPLSEETHTACGWSSRASPTAWGIPCSFHPSSPLCLDFGLFLSLGQLKEFSFSAYLEGNSFGRVRSRAQIFRFWIPFLQPTKADRLSSMYMKEFWEGAGMELIFSGFELFLYPTVGLSCFDTLCRKKLFQWVSGSLIIQNLNSISAPRQVQLPSMRERETLQQHARVELESSSVLFLHLPERFDFGRWLLQPAPRNKREPF